MWKFKLFFLLSGITAAKVRCPECRQVAQFPKNQGSKDLRGSIANFPINRLLANLFELKGQPLKKLSIGEINAFIKQASYFKFYEHFEYE